MASKKKFPGVDKEVLEGLANQFPRSQGPLSQDSEDAPAAADEVVAENPVETEVEVAPADVAPEEPETGAESGAAPNDAPPPNKPEPEPTAEPEPESDPGPAASEPDAAAAAPDPDSGPAVDPAPIEASKPPAPAPPAPRRRGGTLAFLSLLISLSALVMAGAALSPPQLRSWLQERIEYPQVVDFLTGAKAGLDARLRNNAAAIQSADNRLTAQNSRLDAIEAVGGSNEAAARRVDAVEALAAASEQTVLAIDTNVAGFEERLDAAVQLGADADQRLAALEVQVSGRLSDIETGLGALQRASSGPAKLYLIALRLRIAAQTPESFVDEVEAAVMVGVEDERIADALRVLADHAADGVATRTQLWDRFQRQLAPRLRGASRNLSGQFSIWFNGLFTNSGGDSMAAANAAAIAALAEENLSRGRLRSSIEQLAQLEGAFAASAAPWLIQARARVAVDAATATLVTVAFDRFISVND